MDDIETKEVTSTCRDCGNQFETHGYHLYGQTRLVPTVCNPCSELREAKQREQELQAREAAERLRNQQREMDWSKLCPLEFRLKSENDGKTDPARMDASQPEWRNMLAWKFGGRGLIVRGVSGRCKTRAVWRLLRKLWDDKKGIAALTAAQFDRQCRDAAGSFTLTAWFNRLATVDVLFIDDLGKGAWTQSTEAQFFDLLDERTREGRPMIVTCNDDGESLAARLSDDRAEPLVRRLREYCDCVVFQ